MKEKQFQAWVTATAQSYSWRIWHVPTPMRPVGRNTFVPDRRGAGLPDLLMLHEDPPRLIFAELKGDGKHPLSPEQREFLRLARMVARATVEDPGLNRPTVAAYSWRPGQEQMIEAILRSKVLVAN